MTQPVFEWGHNGDGVSLLFPLTLLTLCVAHGMTLPLISHCCHGHPIPIATKGLHRPVGTDRDFSEYAH